MISRDSIEAVAAEGYRHTGVFNPSRFQNDVANLFVVRRLATKFIRSSTVNEKLLVNHVVLALNAFGPKKATLLLRLVASNDCVFGVIKSVLMFLRTFDHDLIKDNPSNRIMDDILKDTAVRYNLEHL